MPKPGPRTIHRYGDAFKASAVRLSLQPGVRVSDVAQSLYIHPFMLSRWRRLAREGVIVTKSAQVGPTVAAELKALRQIKRQYEQLKVEHDLLKKRSRSLPIERRDLHLHRTPQGNLSGEGDVPPFPGQCRRLLRLGSAAGK